jgi:tripartite-type tricarboxylate transporter receptor subunit TctC
MHLAGVMFAQMTGTDLTHVAVQGQRPGHQRYAGQHHRRDVRQPARVAAAHPGRQAARAGGGRQARSPSLPDVPTIAEAGLAGYEVDPWFGVYGPAGMPARIVKALNDAFTEALALPDIKDKLTQAGFTPRGSSAEALAKLTQSEYQRLGEVAKKAGMTAD